jgi:3-oxoacyl-[acyl-carrier protein] reductase
MGRLGNKVALVTGASKGIGAEIARELAAEGAAVVVNYATSRDAANKVVADIERKGGKAVAIQGDVAKAGDVKRVVAETRRAFGRIDVVVNNAGIYETAPLEEITEEHFHRHFNTNVLGPLLVTQEAVKHFGPDGGSIVNFSTVVTRVGPPTWATYVGSKSAVEGITRVLAKELGSRKIRVNAVGPGVVETEGTHAAKIVGGDFEREMVAHTPLGRTGQPTDIARVVAFLASDDARWITGETVVVSGGA